MNYSSNSVTEDAFSHLRVGPTWVPVYLCLYIPIMILSVTGNLLVLVSFCRETEIRKRRHNYFIASLAFVDLLTGLIAVPSTVVARLLKTRFTCLARTRPILHIPGYTFCTASVNHLVVISADRYIAVTRVLNYQSIITKRRCFLLIAFAWTVALMFGLAPVLGCMANPPDLSICDGHRYKAKSVTLHSLAIIALIPSVLMVVISIYARVLLITRKASHKRTKLSDNSKSSSAREAGARVRVTVTMVMVLGAFIFCWLPTVFKHIYEIYQWDNLKVMFVIRTIVEVMAYSNSMVNPVIYGYRNHLFRKAYKELLESVCIYVNGKNVNHGFRTLTVRFRLTSNSNTDTVSSPI